MMVVQWGSGLAEELSTGISTQDERIGCTSRLGNDDYNGKVNALLRRADICIATGHFSNALKDLNLAFDTLPKNDNSRQRAAVLGARGGVHLQLGHVEKAKTDLKQSLSIAAQHHNSKDFAEIEAATLINLGKYEFSYFEDWDQAQEYFERAAERAKFVGRYDLAAKAWLNYGRIELQQAGPDSAEENIQESRVNIIQITDPQKKAFLLISLGQLLREYSIDGSRLSC
jgi:tetratricopeptide (TPR) repeat protein